MTTVNVSREQPSEGDVGRDAGNPAPAGMGGPCCDEYPNCKGHVGVQRCDCNRLRHEAEEYQCLEQVFDERGVPTHEDGKRLSHVGRFLATTPPQEPEAVAWFVPLRESATPIGGTSEVFKEKGLAEAFHNLHWMFTKALIPLGPLHHANDEAVRLREIEHLAWHVLDNTEERDDCWVIDKKICGDDMQKLAALLPEDHPTHKQEGKGNG